MAEGGGDLLETARRVAGSARPGEQVEAYVLRRRETDVRVFGGEVESLSVAEVAGVGVRVVVAGRLGYAWAGSLEPGVVDETLAEARDNAAFAAADDANGLPDRGASDGFRPAELDLWRDEVLAAPVEEKVRTALEVERATRRADPRVRGVESAGYGDAAAEVAVASSLGVEAASRRTTCSVASVALAGEGTGTQTGYGFSVGRAPGDLDVDAAAGDAAGRAVRLLGATQAASRRLPVVLDPLVTASLLGVLAGALSGEAVRKGRSMFVGREGERVAAAHVTLRDDPTCPAALGAAAFDAEGVVTRHVTLVADGILAGFLYDVTTARRAGRATTGSAVRGGYGSPPGVGVRALHLRPGRRAPGELLSSLDDALYVQSVSGLHSGTNPVSGDFSVGAEGLMVRGGAFAEPVREVTIASTLPRMLLELVEVADDLTWLPGSTAGATVLLGEMTMSGR